MFKKIRMGLLCLAVSALSTVAIAQSFTTFINARVTTQLDLQGTLTANGSTGTLGQFLTSNGAGDVTWTTSVGVPGGSDTQVQYNDGGVFGGDAGMTYNETTNTLSVDNVVLTLLNGIAPTVCVNPTGTIGLTAVNGSADTCLRSDGAPALSQAIAPTWTNPHTFVSTSGAPTNIVIRSSDAPADEKNSIFRQSAAGPLAISSASDAAPLVPLTNAIVLDRVGSAWSTFTIGNATDNPPVVFPSSTGATFSGSITGTRPITSVTDAGLVLSSGTPATVFDESDATADNRRWINYATDEDFRFTLYNDSGSIETSWMTVARTATTVDSVSVTGRTISAGNFSSGGIQLGRSGTGYGQVANNVVYTSGAAFNYAVSDTAAKIDFSNGNVILQTAPAGTTGNPITFTNRVTVTPTSVTVQPHAIFDNGVTATAGVNAGNRFSASTQSPTTLAADTNNWALTPVPVVLIAASTGGINITGIDATTANADAQSLGNNVILHLINTSTQRLTLDHESASSTAANRFTLPNNQAFGLAPNASVSVYYDSVVSRWRTVGSGIQTEVFSFTLNFTNACTTTSTILMSAAKFGNVVSMRGNGSFTTCTGDSTSFGTTADVPAGLIPDANACFAIGNAASDNGLAVSARFCIQSDGTVVIHECPLDGVAGFGCSAGTWTASGNRFIDILSNVFTYNLDQV